MVVPPEGFITKVKVIRVIDGDTAVVEITRRFPVRFIDPDDLDNQFNMPELNTKLGRKVKEYLIGILQGCNATLWIPAGKSSIKLTDINSFNRLIGALWINGQSIAALLKEYVRNVRQYYD